MDKIKSWITSHKLISAVIALVLVGGVAYGFGNSNNKDSSQNGTSSQNSTNGTSKNLSIAKDSKEKEGKIWFLIKQNSSSSESNMPSLKSSVSEIIYIKDGKETTYNVPTYSFGDNGNKKDTKVMRDFIGKSDKEIISEAKKLNKSYLEDNLSQAEYELEKSKKNYESDLSNADEGDNIESIKEIGQKNIDSFQKDVDEAKNKLDNYKEPKPEKISFEGEIYDDGERLKMEKIESKNIVFKTSTNLSTFKLLKEFFSGYKEYSSSSSSSSNSYLITKVPNDKTYYILDNPKDVKEIR